jgi:DNA end-binding protein Ku
MAVAHKSAISVGMLYIPVGLYKTTRDIGISFNQLYKGTHERIKYKKYCPSCDKEVKTEEIIKGYEYEDGKYVTMDEEELEAIKTKKDKTIHILHFAHMSEVDQIYYEKNYYVIPDPGGEKALELLRVSMLEEKRVAIAKTVIGTNENMIVLYPTEDGMIAKTLFYQEEIQEIPKSPAKIELQPAEIDMAKMLINTMSKEFDITQYHDEYQEKLRTAIQQKINGEEIVTADTGPQNNIIDLMEALKKSVELSKNNDLKGTA